MLAKKKNNSKKTVKKVKSSPKDIERLLNEQTSVILGAVDEKLQRTESKMGSMMDEKIKASESRMGDVIDKKLQGTELRMSDMMDEKLQESEMRVNQKLDMLITSIDRFLKRMTDIEDEFEIMKLDINRLKKVIKDRLGIDLT